MRETTYVEARPARDYPKCLSESIFRRWPDPANSSNLGHYMAARAAARRAPPERHLVVRTHHDGTT